MKISDYEDLFADEDGIEEEDGGIKLDASAVNSVAINDIKDILNNKTNIEKIKYFYQGVDRILAKSLKLKVIPLTGREYGDNIYDQPKGFCDTTKNIIGLNVTAIGRESKNLTDFVMALKGINYHELAHWLYGVRNLSDEVSDICLELNILNDCRDESLFTIEFPKSKDYFRFAVITYIKKKNPANFLLIWGRRAYIPIDVVDQFEKGFVKQYGDEIAKKAKDIIDKFICSSDIDEHHKLARELHDLIPRLGISYIPIPMRDDLARLVVARSGASKNDLKRLVEVLKEVDDKLKDKQNKEKKEDGKGKDEKGGESAKDGESDNSTESKSEDVKDVKDSNIIGKAGDESSDENDDNQDFGQHEDELKEMLKDIIEQTKETTNNDIQDDLKSIGKLAIPYTPPAKQFTSTPFKPESEVKYIEKKLEKVIKEVYDELAPHTMRRQRKGRVCTRSLLKEQASKNPSMKIFKKFEKNRQDQAKMAIALLVDNSGSMSGYSLTKAKNATWAIAEAMENNDNAVTIITFRTPDSTRLVKDFYNKGWWSYTSNGGTDPVTALLWAEKMLLHIKQVDEIKNLIVCTVSDGEWANTTDTTAEDVIRKFNREGIIETVEINIAHSQFHGSKHQILIRNYGELPKSLRDIMEKLQKNIVNRIRW